MTKWVYDCEPNTNIGKGKKKITTAWKLFLEGIYDFLQLKKKKQQLQKPYDVLTWYIPRHHIPRLCLKVYNILEKSIVDKNVLMVKLSRLERQCVSTNKLMNEEIEEKKKVIKDLSERLENSEKTCRELQEELAMVRQKACSTNCLGFIKATVNLICICCAELWKNSAVVLLWFYVFCFV